MQIVKIQYYSFLNDDVNLYPFVLSTPQVPVLYVECPAERTRSSLEYDRGVLLDNRSNQLLNYATVARSTIVHPNYQIHQLK